MVATWRPQTFDRHVRGAIGRTVLNARATPSPCAAVEITRVSPVC